MNVIKHRQHFAEETASALWWISSNIFSTLLKKHFQHF